MNGSVGNWTWLCRAQRSNFHFVSLQLSSSFCIISWASSFSSFFADFSVEIKIIVHFSLFFNLFFLSAFDAKLFNRCWMNQFSIANKCICLSSGKKLKEIFPSFRQWMSLWESFWNDVFLRNGYNVNIKSLQQKYEILFDQNSPAFVMQICFQMIIFQSVFSISDFTIVGLKVFHFIWLPKRNF